MAAVEACSGMRTELELFVAAVSDVTCTCICHA